MFLQKNILSSNCEKLWVTEAVGWLFGKPHKENRRSTLRWFSESCLKHSLLTFKLHHPHPPTLSSPAQHPNRHPPPSPPSDPTAARCTTLAELPVTLATRPGSCPAPLAQLKSCHFLIDSALSFCPCSRFPIWQCARLFSAKASERRKRLNTLSLALRETSGSNGWNKSGIYPQWWPFVWWVCSFWGGERLIDLLQFVQVGLNATCAQRQKNSSTVLSERRWKCRKLLFEFTSRLIKQLLLMSQREGCRCVLIIGVGRVLTLSYCQFKSLMPLFMRCGEKNSSNYSHTNLPTHSLINHHTVTPQKSAYSDTHMHAHARLSITVSPLYIHMLTPII